jgi:preprotein translocase subunit SecA
MSARLLPRAGLAFGRYPERQLARPHPLRDGWRTLASWLQPAGRAALPAAVAAAAAHWQARALQTDDDGRAMALDLARTALMREGLRSAAVGPALGLACDAMWRSIGLRPYPTQQLAAWMMLQGRLAEMATGEGKTLATGLAAGVAALAGVPVHVLTANDYLVRRDADTLAPFFRALGLASGAVCQATPRAERAALYRRPVVYVTAKELGFDYLRDHHQLGGARDPRLLRAQAMQGGADAAPVLPGLCLALVDEADSLLLDEACVPLILASQGNPPDPAPLLRAYAIAGQLGEGRDFVLDPGHRQATLSAAGRQRLAQAVSGAGGVLRPLRRAQELVQAALVARLLLARDREYVRTERGLALVDELTGRIAEGRQWSGALHAMVEIKEGLAPGAPSTTSAQITYQRLCPRYLHLAGMSGTLAESRLELRRLYGCRVERVPLARPNRREWLGRRLVVDQAAKWSAVVSAVKQQVVAGRPVMVGTDSVAASQHLADRLAEAGIVSQVLNAMQDKEEAARVARAGQAGTGTVTVTTNMAGRGTDIVLDSAARGAGGLHVIAALANRSRRIDRQLVGRAARHGDPGSAECLVALDDPLLARFWPRWVRRAATAAARGGVVPDVLAQPLITIAQRAAEWHDTRLRRRLRQADRQAEESYAFAGNRE